VGCFPLSSVMAVCCVLLRILETISFTVSFSIVIIEGDYQLIHGLEGIGFALFPVCYRILEAIW